MRHMTSCTTSRVPTMPLQTEQNRASEELVQMMGREVKMLSAFFDSVVACKVEGRCWKGLIAFVGVQPMEGSVACT